MNIPITNNRITCPYIDASIHHMECNDDCQCFVGCALSHGVFFVNCGYDTKHMEQEKVEQLAQAHN